MSESGVNPTAGMCLRVVRGGGDVQWGRTVIATVATAPVACNKYFV